MAKISEVVVGRNVWKTVEISGVVVSVGKPEKGPLAELKVSDESGEVRVVAWVPQKALEQLKEGDVVKVRGQLKPFKGELNICVDKDGCIELLTPAEKPAPKQAPAPAPQPQPSFTDEEIAILKKLVQALKSLLST